MSDEDLSEVSVHQLGSQTSVFWVTGLSFRENRKSCSAMRKNNEATKIKPICCLHEVTAGVYGGDSATCCIGPLQLLVLCIGLIKLLIKTYFCVLKSSCIGSQDSSFTVAECLFGYQ